MSELAELVEKIKDLELEVKEEDVSAEDLKLICRISGVIIELVHTADSQKWPDAITAGALMVPLLAVYQIGVRFER